MSFRAQDGLSEQHPSFIAQPLKCRKRAGERSNLEVKKPFFRSLRLGQTLAIGAECVMSVPVKPRLIGASSARARCFDGAELSQKVKVVRVELDVDQYVAVASAVVRND